MPWSVVLGEVVSTGHTVGLDVDDRDDREREPMMEHVLGIVRNLVTFRDREVRIE